MYRCALRFLPVVLLLIAASGHTQSFTKSSIPTRPLPVGVKSADVDRNGLPDLILISGTASDTSNQEIVVHLNYGSGAFGSALTFNANAGTVSEFETVDVNRDGRLDLVYAGKDKLGVMLGRGDGTFGAPRLHAGSIAHTQDHLNSLGSCDLNRDGNSDFVVSSESKLQIFFGNSDGTLKPAQLITVAARAEHAETGDLDGDGNCDVAFVILHPLEDGAEQYESAEIQAWYGDGKGGFTFKRSVDQNLPFFDGFRIFDVTRDGRMDIATILHFCGGGGCDTTMPAVYVSQAGRAFRETAHPLQGNENSPIIHSFNGPAIGDFNNDGTLDLAGSGFQDVEFVMANFYPLASDGTFGLGSYVVLGPRQGPPFFGTGDVVSADFNADGRADLAVAITEQNRIAVLLNTAQRVASCAKGALFTERVCSPGNNSLNNSPVRVQAVANSDQRIVASTIYVNGVKQYTIAGGRIDTNFALPDGDYRLTMKAWDATGRVFTSTANIAARKCALGPPQSVNICSLFEGGAYSSMVPVIASANSIRRITGWKVYVDGVAVVEAGAAPVLLSHVSMTRGTHRVTVRAWDISGTPLSKTVSITVQ